VSDTSVHTLIGSDPTVEIPPQPIPNPDTQGFWDATERDELALCRCEQCRTWMHPPLERCRICGGKTAFETVSGRGRIYSFIVMHRSSVPGLGPPPHVLVVVDIEDTPGVRLSGMLIGIDPWAVEIGVTIEAQIVDVPGGQYRAPQFVVIEEEVS